MNRRQHFAETLQVRVPQGLTEALVRHAQREAQTTSAIVRAALVHYVRTVGIEAPRLGWSPMPDTALLGANTSSYRPYTGGNMLEQAGAVTRSKTSRRSSSRWRGSRSGRCSPACPPWL